MVTVVLEVGSERIVYEADSWREALAIASNLLSTQEELRVGWKLRIDAEGSGLKVMGPKVN
jgi:hypothetical protein